MIRAIVTVAIRARPATIATDFSVRRIVDVELRQIRPLRYGADTAAKNVGMKEEVPVTAVDCLAVEVGPVETPAVRVVGCLKDDPDIAENPAQQVVAHLDTNHVLQIVVMDAAVSAIVAVLPIVAVGNQPDDPAANCLAVSRSDLPAIAEVAAVDCSVITVAVTAVTRVARKLHPVVVAKTLVVATPVHRRIRAAVALANVEKVVS